MPCTTIVELAYHNHDFEFNKFEKDITGFDILLGETDKALLKFELDIYWVTKAGLEPVTIEELLDAK